MTYTDTCRKRIAALDGTELTPAQRGELRAIASSRNVPPDVARSAAALTNPAPPEIAAGYQRGQKRAVEMATTYPILGG